VSRDIVSNVDFAETFLEAAGVPAPAEMQGRSLRAAVFGRAASGGLADGRSTTNISNGRRRTGCDRTTAS
jgi:arylsulfatase A-like enzyme